jgi:hypothetical protein
MARPDVVVLSGRGVLPPVWNREVATMTTEEQLVSARAVFAQSKVCVTSNRVLLAQTRYLIARSRRRLNPVFEVSGGSAPPLRETVRALLASGILLPFSGEVLGATGTGRRCVVCHEAITASEVECEVDGYAADGTRVHLTCFLIWQEESERVPRIRPARDSDLRVP